MEPVRGAGVHHLRGGAARVRFACGHALVCNGCLPVVVEQYKKCPTCDRPFGAQPVAERGTHVRGAPTFVLPE